MTQSISQKGMRFRLPLLLLGTTVLAGCASFSQDGGFDKVASITRERQGIAPQAIKTEQDGENAGEEVQVEVEKGHKFPGNYFPRPM